MSLTPEQMARVVRGTLRAGVISARDRELARLRARVQEACTPAGIAKMVQHNAFLQHVLETKPTA